MSVAQQVQRRREGSARKSREIKLNRTKAILRRSTSDVSKSAALERLDAEGIEKDVELTELIELLPSAVSGVRSAANGTDFLVQKAAKRAAKAVFDRDTEPGGTAGHSDPADSADESTEVQRIVCDEGAAKSLPAYQREFIEKTNAALADPNVSQHVKALMKDQAEQLLHQVNNGGSIEPDFNSLEQIGKLGTIQKGVASPARLAEQLAAAYETAALAQKQLLGALLPQIEELDERVTKTVDNKNRIAKSEPILYDASNARTASMIEAAIRDVTATSATLTSASTTSGGTSGAAGAAGNVKVGPSVGGSSGVAGSGHPGDAIRAAGVQRVTPGPVKNEAQRGVASVAAVELSKCEKELAEAPDALSKAALGERVSYWRLVKMHGG